METSSPKQQIKSDKLKYKDGNLISKAVDQVQIQSDIFSKQFFGQNTPFGPNAIKELKSILVKCRVTLTNLTVNVESQQLWHIE